MLKVQRTLHKFEGGGEAQRLDMMQHKKRPWDVAAGLLVTFKKTVSMKKWRWKTDYKMIKIEYA